MICKWCGASLREGATKCSRCSKSVPAKSDCGGFYDLIVNPPQPTAEVQKQPAVPQKPVTEVISSMGAGRNRKQPEAKKSPLIPLGINLAVIAVMAVLLLGMNSKLKGYEETAKRHEEKIAELQMQQTEPEQETVLLENQAVKTIIQVGQDENGLGATVAECDLGDHTGKLYARVVEDVIHLDLDDTQDCATISIHRVGEKDGNPGSLAVDFGISAEMFAEAVGTPQWKWEYRLSQEEGWQTLDPVVEQEIIAASTEETTQPVEETLSTEQPTEPETSPTVPEMQPTEPQVVPFELFRLNEKGALEYRQADWFAQWNHLDSVEFRLTYTRQNTKGGSMTIVLDGITVEKPALEVEKPVDQTEVEKPVDQTEVEETTEPMANLGM